MSALPRSERPRLRREERREGRRLDDRDAAETEDRRARRPRGQRLGSEHEVGEEAGEDRKRREEDRREARVDPLLREEDAGVVDADLEDAAPDDAPALAPGALAGAAREREGGEQRAGERHADAAEPQRRQVPQADLDDEPRRAPDRAQRDVHREASARERGHRTRIL